MIIVKLKHAMNVYRQKTGEKLTYDELSKKTGISRATLESIASRQSYNPTLATIDKLCTALLVEPGDLLELVPNFAPMARVTAEDTAKQKKSQDG